MSVVKFNQLPDSARLWVYACERAFSESEAKMLTDHLNAFMEQWTAHKRELTTAWELRYNQFILIGVDERTMAASGCSIDSLVRSLQEFEKRIASNIVGTNSKVFYRDQNQTIRCVDRSEFGGLVGNDIVNQDTIVFNNTLRTIREVRQGKWEVPMKASWHSEIFGRALV
jgi:hypothetical protein